MRAAAAIIICALTSAAAQQYQVSGIVLAVDTAHKTFTASIGEIPGYMAAMTMPFGVRSAAEIAKLTPGARVDFTGFCCKALGGQSGRLLPCRRRGGPIREVVGQRTGWRARLRS